MISVFKAVIWCRKGTAIRQGKETRNRIADQAASIIFSAPNRVFHEKNTVVYRPRRFHFL
jgi:hypothetical protein